MVIGDICKVIRPQAPLAEGTEVVIDWISKCDKYKPVLAHDVCGTMGHWFAFEDLEVKGEKE